MVCRIGQSNSRKKLASGSFPPPGQSEARRVQQNRRTERAKNLSRGGNRALVLEVPRRTPTRSQSPAPRDSPRGDRSEAIRRPQEKRDKTELPREGRPRLRRERSPPPPLSPRSERRFRRRASARDRRRRRRRLRRPADDDTTEETRACWRPPPCERYSRRRERVSGSRVESLRSSWSSLASPESRTRGAPLASQTSRRRSTP